MDAYREEREVGAGSRKAFWRDCSDVSGKGAHGCDDERDRRQDEESSWGSGHK